MKPLDLPQKIKVLIANGLRVPVIRTASEPYDPEKPSIFDKSITKEVIEVNTVIRSLLGIISMLHNELKRDARVFTPEQWNLLKESKRLLDESRSSIRRL